MRNNYIAGLDFSFVEEFLGPMLGEEVTQDTAARMLGVSRQTIRAMLLDGRLEKGPKRGVMVKSMNEYAHRERGSLLTW